MTIEQDSKLEPLRPSGNSSWAAPLLLLGGAFALDFGGKQASAVSSGIIDGVGYPDAVAAGDSVARVAVTFG